MEYESEVEEILQKCYKMIDTEREALLTEEITKAFECQSHLKQYMKNLDRETKEQILNYKREKFEELVELEKAISNKVVETQEEKNATEPVELILYKERGLIYKFFKFLKGIFSFDDKF